MAEIRPYIIDLNSTNGTFLNGKQLESAKYYSLFEVRLQRTILMTPETSISALFRHNNNGRFFAGGRAEIWT